MIKYKANKFKSKYKINNKSSAEYLKSVIHKLGCNLLTYSDEVMKLSALNLLKKSKTAPALSDIDDKGNITVFYNDELPFSVQRLALAHELGHIVLGHLYLESIGERQEDEADKFAEYILSPTDNIKIEMIHITCIILCLCLSIVMLCDVFAKNNKTVDVVSNIVIEEYYKSATNVISEANAHTVCYYARYSEVYHIYRYCYYLKNSTEIYTNTIGECHLDRLCSACERRLNNK